MLPGGSGSVLGVSTALLNAKKNEPGAGACIVVDLPADGLPLGTRYTENIEEDTVNLVW